MENYGALMRRQTETFTIDINSATAGIGVEIYGILIAILLFLFLMTAINERVQHSNDRNSTWHLLISLFPSNGAMWPQQTGWTRKVLMATSGFSILILSSLYQAKLAEQLMIPNRPSVVTLKDIENGVASGRIKLILPYMNAPIVQYISIISPALATYINTTKTVYESDSNRTLELIESINGLSIAPENTLLSYLSKMPDNKCANYMYVPFEDGARALSGMIMRKERRDMLESWNAIVAERMSYVDTYMQTFQLSKECRKHIFPIYTSNPTYGSLQLMAFLGAFALLCILLCFSIVVFVGERVFHVHQIKMCVNDDDDAFVQPFHIYLNCYIGRDISNQKRNTIQMHYMKILEEMEHCDEWNGE
jgi:hypothetical protein